MQGVFNGLFCPQDLLDSLLLGHALSMGAVKIQRIWQVVNIGDLGELEAQIVILGAIEGCVNPAYLVINTAAHQAKVEQHEINQEAFFGVRNLAAAAFAPTGALFVDYFVVGVDESNLGMGVEDGKGIF